MDSSYVWSELRDRALRAFAGQTPRPEDEAAIIEVFERHPMLVEHAISEVGDELARGEIRWAWSILRSRVERGAVPAREAVPDDRTRDGRVAQARQWMHAAGIHYAQESELEDELFGERGRLHLWRNDLALVSEMLGLWRQVRPQGVRVEQEAVIRAEAYKASRRAQTKPTPELPPVDPDELVRDLLGHAERRVALHAASGNPFLDD
jgi:hypothetical protein